MTRYMTMKSLRLLPLLAVLLAASITGCEDAPPNDYQPRYVVQAYMIVDQPIQGIVVSKSQSVTDTFRIASGVVPDANVKIIADGRTLQLVYRADESGPGEYYYPDTTELVKPNMLYKLEITVPGGGTITAQTLTPGRFAWVHPPVDTVSIPAKSSPAYLNPPDSLDLTWDNRSGNQEFLIRVGAEDTLEYGRYLANPTSQKNQRINPDLDKQDERHYTDVTRWGFVASTTTPIVWAAFKWYGRQDVSVYAADRAFINWFKMTYWTGNPQYDPLLANVQGDGIGVFGSASVIHRSVFVLMNQ
ncbi:MAG TPA: DUF4249 family protein [Candidatus Kapabacteria bacterium]|nr:DUF4249 family protein [Candidatus Kapabacteria bacterium]